MYIFWSAGFLGIYRPQFVGGVEADRRPLFPNMNLMEPLLDLANLCYTAVYGELAFCRIPMWRVDPFIRYTSHFIFICRLVSINK